MGTRGTTGFIIDGNRKSGYQQYDSYPSGVGVEVLTFVRKIATPEAAAAAGIDLKQVHKLARDLKIVSESGTPTKAELAKIGDTYHQDVSTGSDWYAYLRGTQGNPAAILDSGYITGQNAFQQEEYDYIIDFDKRELVVYEGTATLGRFGFDDLPTDEVMAALG